MVKELLMNINITIQDIKVEDYLSEEWISLHFTPPRAPPHFEGL